MPNSRQRPQENSPSITLADGIARMKFLLSRADNLLAAKPISEAAYKAWDANARDCFTATFGSDLSNFRSFWPDIPMVTGLPGGHLSDQANHRARQLEYQRHFLSELIAAKEAELSIAATPDR